MLIFSIKIWYFWRLFSFLPNKTQKKVFLFFKTNPMSLLHQKLFQPACDTKINKIKDINMASIKGNTYFIYWNILPLSQNTLQTKSRQNYQIISKTCSKNISKKKVLKKNNHDIFQVILNVSCSSIFFQILHGFSKRQITYHFLITYVNGKS